MDLVYYMRGALQYHDALQLSPMERQIGFDYINKRLEQASKMQYPVF
jgi:hypothetical protein